MGGQRRRRRSDRRIRSTAFDGACVCCCAGALRRLVVCDITSRSSADTGVTIAATACSAPILTSSLLIGACPSVCAQRAGDDGGWAGASRESRIDHRHVRVVEAAGKPPSLRCLRWMGHVPLVRLSTRVPCAERGRARVVIARRARPPTDRRGRATGGRRCAPPHAPGSASRWAPRLPLRHGPRQRAPAKEGVDHDSTARQA